MIILLIGPAGSGKTTIGQLLAAKVGWQFADADSFHSQKNIEKMAHGIPLNDDDRAPWLEAMRQAILGWIEKQQNVALACSALKRSYRAALEVSREVKPVYLKASRELLIQRLQNRKGHFAHEDLVASQLADLEEPTDALIVDASKAPEEIIEEIRAGFSLL